MNLWLRLIWCLLTARFRAPADLPFGACELSFRVGLFDLDTSLHMNNGRYLTVMDLGRLDLMLRSDLWRVVLRNKWVPIANATMIRYRRELNWAQRFRLRTRIVCWDEKSVVMEQTFIIAGGERDGQVAAQGLFKGGIYNRKGKSFVPVSVLMEGIGVSAVSPEPDGFVATFLRADQEMKLEGRTLN